MTALTGDADGGRASAALDDAGPGVVTCTYRAGAPAAEVVRVTVDDAPQAAWRFSRAVVERGQAHLGGPRRELPQQVGGVGDGAAWVAGPRELSATGRGRLVTVTVVARGSGAPPDRAAAIAVARAALG